MGANEKVRVGVIGVGRMGQFHVNVYSEMPEVELAGVADINSGRGSAIREKFNVEYFRDYHELLKKIDVASIAVPTGLHYEIAKEALNQGVHLLVEKPISNSYEKAYELFEIAEKRGLVLQVGHVERFNGAVQELHKIVEDPILVQCRRMGPFDPRVAHDSVVLDLMIHDIDIVLNLIKSEVDELYVTGSSIVSQTGDVVTAQIKFASGCMATFTASRVTQNKMRNMSVTCKSKYIYLDFADQEIHVHRMATSKHELRKNELRYQEESIMERIFVHRDNPLKLELSHLIDCVKNGADRAVSVDSELKSLRMALDIIERYQAANAG